MKIFILQGLLVSLLIWACDCGEAPKAYLIVRIARSYINTSHLLTTTSSDFVARVLQEANAFVPKGKWPHTNLIGAEEWANPNSFVLFMSSCWQVCAGGTRPGDVIAMDGHVAIVTTSSHKKSVGLEKGGMVRESSWGFLPGQRPTCWRFRYDRTETCFRL